MRGRQAAGDCPRPADSPNQSPNRKGRLSIVCGFVGHDFFVDETTIGRPACCKRCNWWGGFTVMELQPASPMQLSPETRLPLKGTDHYILVGDLPDDVLVIMKKEPRHE